MAFAANEIVILATARAKPGREADLEAALREVAAPTRGAEGLPAVRAISTPAGSRDDRRI